MDYLKSECNRRYPGVSIDFRNRWINLLEQKRRVVATLQLRYMDHMIAQKSGRYDGFEILIPKHTGGRLFVKAYYAISPQIVKRFGETSWFNHFWKKRLDKMVKRLRKRIKILLMRTNFRLAKEDTY